jgi:hypothetical protein
MIRLISEQIDKSALEDIARGQFGDMVKAVVDIEKGIMAIGGELHADEEAILLETGSQQEHLWGINIYPELTEEEWIEFDSMTNIRPSRCNRSRGVENEKVRSQIIDIVKKLIITQS